MEEQRTRIVVGVVPGQPKAVIVEASLFAQRFDAELVCASVDASPYTVIHQADGTVVSMPIDPDLVDDVVEEFDPTLHASIAEILGGVGGGALQWSVRALAGGPAQELSELAEEIDAAMIVVGIRVPGIRGHLHEFFNGSVAVQLAHRQHRPVVVVPLHPVGAEVQLHRQIEE